MIGGITHPLITSVLDEPPSAKLWSSVYDYYWIFGVAAGVITFALIIFLMVRYRSRAGQTVPIEKQREYRETWKGPLLLFLLMGIVLTLVAVQTLNALPVYNNPPNAPGRINVQVTAQQFFFQFTYPNNMSSTELVVPVDRVIMLNVTSKDVNHQFGISAFRVKTDAIPARHNIVWIKPNTLGNFTIQCYELCGVGHATMITKLVVLSPQDFGKWYNSTATAAASGG